MNYFLPILNSKQVEMSKEKFSCIKNNFIMLKGIFKLFVLGTKKLSLFK